MLAPICCEMLTDTASRPLPVMSSVRSGDPGNTWPMSAMRTVAPFFTSTGVAPISSTDDHRPDTSERCCWPASEKRPTGCSWFCAFSTAATSETVRPAADSLSGSSTTSISRVSLASASMWPAPGTRASAGRIT